MSLVKRVFLQSASFLLCFFSLVNDRTMTGIVVGIFLLLSPARVPKTRHAQDTSMPNKAHSQFPTSKTKTITVKSVVYKDVYFLPGKEMKMRK